jgi:hypothetical protein
MAGRQFRPGILDGIAVAVGAEHDRSRHGASLPLIFADYTISRIASSLRSSQ